MTVPALARPTSASGLERATELKRQGRAEQALPLTDGDSLEARIRRAEILVTLTRYSEVVDLVEDIDLGQAVSPPWDYRLRLLQGRVQRIRGDLVAAERFYRDAARLAVSDQQKVEAGDRLVALYDRREQWDKADEVQKGLENAVAGLSGLDLAEHLVDVGEYQQRRGRRTEAMASFAAARSLYQALDAPVMAADTMLSMAADVSAGGDDDRAWAMVDQALSEAIASNAPDRVVSAVQSLANLGRVSARKQITQARSNAAVALLPPGRYQDSARLEALLYGYQMGGEPGPALEGLKALEARRDLDTANRLTTLFSLSALEAAQGRPRQARAYLDKTLGLVGPRFFGELNSGGARGPVLYVRSELERQEHEFEKARQTLHQAIAAQPGQDWAGWRSVAHYNALLVTILTYDLEGAREELKEGLESVMELDGAGAKAAGVTRLLAALALNQSLSEDLIDPAERALSEYDPLSRALLTEMLAPDGALGEYLRLYDSWTEQSRAHRDTFAETSALIYKALFLEAAGRNAEALAVVGDGITLAEKNDLTRETAIGYLLRARLENADGRVEATLDSLSHAAEQSSKLTAPSAAFHHLVLGSYQLSHGRPQQALSTYGEAIEALPSRGWRGLYGQARAYEELNQPQRALECLDKALAAPETAERPVSRATLISARARLLLAAGQTDQALKAFASCYPTLLETGQSALLGAALAYSRALSESDQKEQALERARAGLDVLMARGTASMDTLQPLFERVANLSLELGQEGQALRYLELSHSAELVGSVELSRVEASDPATQHLLSDLAGLKQKLEGLQREADVTERGAKREGLDKVLASTRQQFFVKLDELKRNEPEFESLVQLSGSSLSAIQAGLDKDTALLEFFPSETTLYLFVVTHDGMRLHQVLVGRQKLADLVNRYADLARDPDSDPKSLGEAARLLYSLLWEPAAEELGARTRVRLVPSGPLWRLPFEALQDGQGRTLDSRYEVSWLTSADVLRTLSTRGQAGASRAVLLGAPDAEDLPGARSELDALARLLPRASLLTGGQATSTALRDSAHQASILHIASHSGSGGKTGECYISLADGPFSLEKIYGLSLSRGALVVLSSCRSALGEANPGREVTSLASAFNIAGASTVVASHWEVDDAATEALFVSFYRNLLQGKGRGEALRLARQELARSHPHPYYWAAFSLFGDPH